MGANGSTEGGAGAAGGRGAAAAGPLDHYEGAFAALL